MSSEQDGLGFFYGFHPNGDARQINVRYERRDEDLKFGAWTAYVGGIEIDRCESKAEAEAAAIRYIETDDPQPLFASEAEQAAARKAEERERETKEWSLGYYVLVGVIIIGGICSALVIASGGRIL